MGDQGKGVLRGFVASAPHDASPQAETTQPWSFSFLSLGAALGLLFSVVAANPARAFTAEQFSQLTYSQVIGSGVANRCPTVNSNGTSVKVKKGDRMKNFCLEPKSFAVEAETDKGKEFVTTKLMTRQTYTLAFMEGAMDTNPVSFQEEDGMDFAATT